MLMLVIKRSEIFFNVADDEVCNFNYPKVSNCSSNFPDRDAELLSRRRRIPVSKSVQDDGQL